MTQCIVVGLNELGRSIAIALALLTDHRIILLDSTYVDKEESPNTGYATEDRGYLRTEAVAFAIEDVVPGGLARLVRVPQADLAGSAAVIADLCTGSVETIVIFCAGKPSTKTYLHKKIASNCLLLVSCGYDNEGQPVVKTDQVYPVADVLALEDFGYTPKLKSVNKRLLQQLLGHVLACPKSE